MINLVSFSAPSEQVPDQDARLGLPFRRAPLAEELFSSFLGGKSSSLGGIPGSRVASFARSEPGIAGSQISPPSLANLLDGVMVRRQ